MAQQAPNPPKKMKVLNVRLDPELHKQVRIHCIQNNTTVESFTSEALLEKLERDNEQQKRDDTTHTPDV